MTSPSASPAPLQSSITLPISTSSPTQNSVNLPRSSLSPSLSSSISNNKYNIKHQYKANENHIDNAFSNFDSDFIENVFKIFKILTVREKDILTRGAAEYKETKFICYDDNDDGIYDNESIKPTVEERDILYNDEDSTYMELNVKIKVDKKTYSGNNNINNAVYNNIYPMYDHHSTDDRNFCSEASDNWFSHNPSEISSCSFSDCYSERDNIPGLPYYDSSISDDSNDSFSFFTYGSTGDDDFRTIISKPKNDKINIQDGMFDFPITGLEILNNTGSFYNSDDISSKCTND